MELQFIYFRCISAGFRILGMFRLMVREGGSATLISKNPSDSENKSHFQFIHVCRLPICEVPPWLPGGSGLGTNTCRHQCGVLCGLVFVNRNENEIRLIGSLFPVTD